MSATSDDSARAAHLQMIQGVITRMASNSFSLKTVSVTLTAAVVAYYGAVPRASWLVAAAAWAGIFVFWFLDARYLQLERLFRALYDGVRTGTVAESYSMNVSLFRMNSQSVLRIAVSWSVLWIYLFLAVLLAILLATRPVPQAEPVAGVPGGAAVHSAPPLR